MLASSQNCIPHEGSHGDVPISWPKLMVVAITHDGVFGDNLTNKNH